MSQHIIALSFSSTLLQERSKFSKIYLNSSTCTTSHAHRYDNILITLHMRFRIIIYIKGKCLSKIINGRNQIRSLIYANPLTKNQDRTFFSLRPQGQDRYCPFSTGCQGSAPPCPRPLPARQPGIRDQRPWSFASLKNISIWSLEISYPNASNYLITILNYSSCPTLSGPQKSSCEENLENGQRIGLSQESYVY
ncbi:hypothetical protein H8356DRAFT_1353810 [Neocallimastix lanati (nom. inval.)]|nr:hypothetical protein H8356DRAFT_1353810 [Neocallimastix sp. JGI-2020a]